MSQDRWYFAYGSNLSINQKEIRTGTIRKAVRCRLPGFRLAFNKRGSRGEVFANIVPEAGNETWGVIYLCDPRAIEELDVHEGVGKGHYEHTAVTVFDDSGKAYEALTYVACKESVCNPGQPSEAYLSTIVTGARQHALPEAYVAKIKELARG
jgi:cation transport regulator ChaC